MGDDNDELLIHARRISFAEFELYYNSTERVSDRRVNLLQSGTSNCLIMLAGIGVMLGWGATKYTQGFVFGSVMLAVSIASILGAIYSSWFLAQIDSYRDLNEAKFIVLNKMSEKLEIDNIRACGECPFDPFDLEWKTMESKKALKKAKSGGLISKATRQGYVIPQGFLSLFAIIAFFAIGMFVANLFGAAWVLT